MAQPTIIFFGNERLATGVSTTAPTLQALLAAGYDVKAVVSHNEAGVSRKQRTLEIAELAHAHHIPLLLPSKPADIIAELQAFGANIGVLVAYGRIVSQAVIDSFPLGIINIHPSLLPKHRGPIPLESVILHGEPETGVSIMGLSKTMDAGPIYAQTTIKLSGTETKQQLADNLNTEGAALVLHTLQQIEAGTARPWVQDESQATTDALIQKQDGVLDFSKSAEQLEREIRAYADWPKSTTVIAGKTVIITSAHALAVNHGGAPGSIEVDTDNGVIMFACATGSLCIDSLKPAGKQAMTTRAFLAGYQQLL